MIVLRNSRMVLADEVVQGSLLIDGDRIVSVDAGSTAALESMDLDGDWLLPGLVEMHTDNLERHLMPRPSVNWAEMPALLAHDAEVAAAGITTVFDALGVGEADPDSLRGSAWHDVVAAFDHCRANDVLRADHLLHVRCELPAPNTIELFAPFMGHERMKLISLMDHTPGQRQWEDIGVARTYYLGKKGWSLEKFERQVEKAATLQALHVQPHRQWFVNYCRDTGVRLASHDDTTVEHVLQAHADGACLSEFPTTIDAASAARRLDLHTVMGAPNVLRGGSHSGNVAAADLAAQGLLTVLSSDYVPSSLMAAAIRLADDGLMSLPAAIATVSSAPATATGLTDRGRIAAGMRADLVRVRLEQTPDGKRVPIVRAVWRSGRRII